MTITAKDELLLEEILEATGWVRKFVTGQTIEEFTDDELISSAVMYKL